MHPIEYVMLEPTNYCNLNCTFCNRRDVVKRQKHISLEDWNIILNKLSGQPIEVIKMQGLGETYLHPKSAELFRATRLVFPDAFIISATNCQFDMKDNFINALPFVDLLYLSIDGYKKSYEKFRPGAKWSKLISFLDRLSDFSGTRTRFTINFVVNEENYKDIEKLHKLVDENYQYIEEIRLNIAQWWSECETANTTESKAFDRELLKYTANIKGKTPWTYSDCWWPEKGFIVDVFGDVRICLLNMNTEPIGNIFKQSLEEIMDSPKRTQVRNECKNNTPGDHCKTCDYKRLSPILGRLI